MFFSNRKRIKELEDKVAVLEMAEKNVVSCEECGVLLTKRHAKELKTDRVVGYATFGGTRYYCKQHKKPYDKVILGDVDEETIYMKYGARVNKDGTPYKEKK